MKKALIISISVIIIFIFSFITYWNLPIEVTRKSDIRFGNELIQKIQDYKKTNNKLPENHDWQTLKKLGFKMEDLGTKPLYAKDSTNTYELSFSDGFEGPYLMWNSQEGKWTIDFPKIVSK
ncbi:hypothetical protein [Chryseobacterium chendengshani]|uniref:hypothetical protein n=1 Tax=Chryseobacterium sp. LJ756 TaxID=2864113 RepID=UPI001C640E35|nr:hypothetical protein [Chryseobacterium sp. LJ756]MBW7676428.1 hypothetical protein [Chryseobacterium sp. LJ756]